MKDKPILLTLQFTTLSGTCRRVITEHAVRTLGDLYFNASPRSFNFQDKNATLPTFIYAYLNDLDEVVFRYDDYNINSEFVGRFSQIMYDAVIEYDRFLGMCNNLKESTIKKVTLSPVIATFAKGIVTVDLRELIKEAAAKNNWGVKTVEVLYKNS